MERNAEGAQMGTERRQRYKTYPQHGATERRCPCRGCEAFPRVWNQFCPWALDPQEVVQVLQNFGVQELCRKDSQTYLHAHQTCLHAHLLSATLLSPPSPTKPGPKENPHIITALEHLEPAKPLSPLEVPCQTPSGRGRL